MTFKSIVGAENKKGARKVMKQKQLLAALSAGIISIGMVSSADAALTGRIAATPGGTDYQAYYDDVADLTWLADGNYAKTSGYSVWGQMTWQEASDWAAQLTVGGVSGWRLPETDTSCGSGSYNCTGSEMGNLFYNALGNTATVDWSVTQNSGPFSNVKSYWSDVYWSGTSQDTTNAWLFNMHYGHQYIASKTSLGTYSWAVQSGDVAVSTVPVPAAVWLFGTGLIGLVAVARRKV